MTVQMPSTADLQKFRETGYWVAPVIFQPKELAALKQAFIQIYNGHLDHRDWPFVPPVINESKHGIRTALFCAYVNRTIEAAAKNPVLSNIAARLLGVEEVRYWQDQSIWKPGAAALTTAGNIGFHQDYAYWQDSSTVNMVSANIALQDVPVERGCLRVFPGSQKLGLLTGSGGDFFNTDLEGLREDFQKKLGKTDIPIELKAGQVSFHHSLLVHGSGPNTTGEDRLVLAPAYMPNGTYYREEGQPPCPHSDFLGEGRRHGTPFEGVHFPLV